MIGPMHDVPDDGVDRTADAIESGVTALTPSAALAIIERWRSACDDQTGLDLDSVAEGLDDLHGLLSSDRLDARAIAQTLAGLAEATAAVASQTDEERVTPGLDRLAAALGRAAAMLGG